MRNKIYAKNTEYIACSQNLSKNLHFRKTFVYLSDVAKSAQLLLPHRFGGLHPHMLLIATRTSHICEFAKSHERK